MNLFKKLTEKPWLMPGLQTSNMGDAVLGQPLSDQQYRNTQKPAKTALNLFLAVVNVIFFLFTITFLSRTQSADFQALAGEPWLPFNNTQLLWLNTGILLLASICLQFASYSANNKQVNRLVLSLTFACLFTGGFFIGQLVVWQQLLLDGYGVTNNPANSYFYLLTGVHGLHLLGGVFALLRVVWMFWHDISFSACAANLQLCARYWHYLFLLWLFLFFLLTATNDTYRTIAVICGF